MTSEQLGILNALVTYAAEHIPGGLSVDEREVAKIVGGWALNGRVTETIDNRIWAQPVFTGTVDDSGEKLVVYRDVQQGHLFHIRLGNGPIQTLSESAQVGYWYDRDQDAVEMKISSPQWTGNARGRRSALLSEQPLRRTIALADANTSPFRVPEGSRET